jgi:hypothetical protein
MSYIDSFRHEFIGFFAGLPVYHPLEVVVDTANFSCTPQNLIMGGGSGLLSFWLKRIIDS